MKAASSARRGGNPHRAEHELLIRAGVPVGFGRLDSDGNPDSNDRRWKGWDSLAPDIGVLSNWRPGDAPFAVGGSSVDILDCDPRNGGRESLDKMWADLGDEAPPVLWSVDTPSGGIHVYIPALGIGSYHGRKAFLPGLELAGGLPDGTSRHFAFTVGAIRPSKETGEPGEYVPRRDFASPNGRRVSPSVAEYVRACYAERQAENGRQRGSKRQASDELRQACLAAEDGEQRGALLDYVTELEMRGYDRDDIVRLVLGLADEMPAYDERSPWRERDIRGLLHKPGHFVPDATPEEIAICAGMRGWHPRDNGAGLLVGVRTGDWLDRQTFAPLQYAVPGLLPAGAVVIAGAPFTGKSVLVLRFALECARGGMVFGISVPRRDTFYLALETNDERMQNSCRELLADDPIPAAFNYILEVNPGKLTKTIGDWLAQHPAGLVVVDTLGKALEKPEKGETTYDRDYRILGNIKKLAKQYTGCTIAVNHHTRKAKSDDFVEAVSGTNAITGAADTVFLLTRTRNSQEGVLRIASRDMDEAEYALLLERPMGWQLDGEDLLDATARATTRADTSALGERSTDIIEFVNDNPDGVDREQVAEELGLSPKDASTYLLRLYESGRIKRIQRGLYGPKINRISLHDRTGA